MMMNERVRMWQVLVLELLACDDLFATSQSTMGKSLTMKELASHAVYLNFNLAVNNPIFTIYIEPIDGGRSRWRRNSEKITTR